MECSCEVGKDDDPRCADRGMCGRYKPHACPHCEYDRRFPGFEGGGWIQQDNNGPIVSCPMCNDDGRHPLHPDRTVDLADVFGYGPSAPGWKEPAR